MPNDIKNWNLTIQTTEDEKYMRPLFDFTMQFFTEIFGEDIMSAEPCILYNDASSSCPMLIIAQVPIQIRTCAKDLSFWAQFIYQLSHEMTHYVIRQHKEDKSFIAGWLEETICEAVSLYILNVASKRWFECELFHSNQTYGKSLEEYLLSEYENKKSSALKNCHTMQALELINSTCESDRPARGIERNYLYDTFCEMPSLIAEFVWYPLYMLDHLRVDFSRWECERKSTQLISCLKNIHPMLEC